MGEARKKPVCKSWVQGTHVMVADKHKDDQFARFIVENPRSENNPRLFSTVPQLNPEVNHRL